MTYGYRGPAIDHGLLSPSGHMSSRARKAAEAISTARLFPPGYWDKPEPTEQERISARVETLRRAAANLRDLAARGMHVRSYPKQASRLEAEADELDRSI